MIEIDQNWTLFLDRDGVINKEIQGEYVKNIDGFIFYDRVPQTIATCSKLFARILLVTNQRGVGRGIMTTDDLEHIHKKMLGRIRTAGGDIQKIYYAPDVYDDAVNRKPNTGMALQAKKDFPDIDFQQSIMVGNNLSDMKFGKSMGMKTIFIKSTRPELCNHSIIDFALDELANLPEVIKNK